MTNDLPASPVITPALRKRRRKGAFKTNSVKDYLGPLMIPGGEAYKKTQASLTKYQKWNKDGGGGESHRYFYTKNISRFKIGSHRI